MKLLSVSELKKKKLSLLACVYSLRLQWHPRDRGMHLLHRWRAPSLLWPRVNLDSITHVTLNLATLSHAGKKESARNQSNSKIVVYLIGPFFFSSFLSYWIIQHLKKCTSFSLWIYSSLSLRSGFRDTMTLVIFSDCDTQWHLAMCKFVSMSNLAKSIHLFIWICEFSIRGTINRSKSSLIFQKGINRLDRPTFFFHVCIFIVALILVNKSRGANLLSRSIRFQWNLSFHKTLNCVCVCESHNRFNLVFANF